MSTLAPRLCVSPSAAQRLAFAAAFVRELPARSPALLLVPSVAAGTRLMGDVLRPGEARFGVQKRTLPSLARELALPVLARERRVPLRSLAREALVVRVVHELSAKGALGRYGAQAERPGFARALARTLAELRLAGHGPAHVAAQVPDLASILEAYEAALTELGLADTAHVYDAASRALVERATRARAVPLLALDVPLASASEASFAQALVRGRTAVAVTVVRGDERSEAYFRLALGVGAEVSRLEPQEGRDLTRLQARLFDPRPVKPREPVAQGFVRFVSSPGEAREAVEIARALAEGAARGVSFDRMAVVLRAVEGYRAVLEEALARAEIPAFFADGVRRPRVEGRAFLALLACARDGLSVRAFAEYLSLDVLPGVEAADGEALRGNPRRWEQLLIDAAVVGGRARWQRRLESLESSLRDELARLGAEEPRQAEVARDLAQVTALARFALPVLDRLAALPEGGTWGDFRRALIELAKVTLREPDAVLDLLEQLAPLSTVGPVSLADVVRLLSRRLPSAIVPSASHGAGKVFVGGIDDVRGRAFELVFVPGLAERIFPARIADDALLSDAVRRALGPELWVSEERVARERLSLRLAVGAAEGELWLSYPRFDVVHGRPRVPSFYGLEVLSAIDGVLPAYDELTRRAEPGAAARMGFPAPVEARAAIDDAEFDLAMLERLLRAPESARRGAARYLLEANVHLARALRFRARRWELTRFTGADGFVASDDDGRALLAPERLTARSYSATALAAFAVCPYRFYLHAIVGLPEPVEGSREGTLDARLRGVLFHEAQRLIASELREAGLLPLARAQLDEARSRLARVFAALSARARDDWAPSIEGALDAPLAGLARDLEEWLVRLASEPRFVPSHFELGFGIALRPDLDARSVETPVPLQEGVLLAGAIDLVERAGGESPGLRATDYKTSAAPERSFVTAGGRVLQPLLYALALEQLFPDEPVLSGRLYFCTTRGEFKSHDVPLDAPARGVARALLGSIDAMVAEGFLPAAPAQQPEDKERSECERCAYAVVCGPFEAERVSFVKSRELTRLSPLFRVRGLP